MSTSLELDVQGVPRGSLRALSATGEEELSKPSRFDVVFGSADPALDLDGLIGAEATLTIGHRGDVRAVRGLVTAAEQGEQADSGAYLYSASIAPLADQPTSAEPPAVLRHAEAGGEGAAASLTRVRCTVSDLPGARAARLTVLAGESSTCTLSAGRRFTLEGHFRGDLNAEYTILKASHRAGPQGYRCAIEAVRSRRARTSLPLEAHLGATDAFTDEDTTAGTAIGSWARIYVPAIAASGNTPATPLSYLRIGGLPSDSPSADVEQAFRATYPVTAHAWPSTWPGSAFAFKGAFQYTDRSRTSVSVIDSNAYAGGNAFSYVAGNTYGRIETSRKLDVGTWAAGKTATRRGSGSYTDENIGGSSSFSTDNAGDYTYADGTTIKGSRKLTVKDLLVDDVDGDHVTFVAGSQVAFVANHHHLEVDGHETQIYNADVSKTAKASEAKSNFGGVMSVRLGGILDIYLGLYVSIALAGYLRIINSRMSWFWFKFDYVSQIKIDMGTLKVDGYKETLVLGTTISKLDIFKAWVMDTSVVLTMGKVYLDACTLDAESAEIMQMYAY